MMSSDASDKSATRIRAEYRQTKRELVLKLNASDKQTCLFI